MRQDRGLAHFVGAISEVKADGQSKHTTTERIEGSHNQGYEWIEEPGP